MEEGEENNVVEVPGEQEEEQEEEEEEEECQDLFR